MIEPVDCIVPAAGRSERMGRWKPLLPFAGGTIIEVVVGAAREACSRIILVTGYRGAELAALFAGRPEIVVVENPDWRLGVFSSIQSGLGALATPRFFVALGDMPFVRPAVFRALLAAPAAEVVVPVRAGRRGHPVLFDARLRGEVLAADPATASMREIAARHPATEVPWEDDTVLRDIDTPEEYTRALEEGRLATS